MKKAFVLVLALVLTLSLALPAAAAGSPGNPEEMPGKIEITLETEDGKQITVTVIVDPEEWTEDQKAEVDADKPVVEASLEEGDTIVLTAYIEIIDEDGETDETGRVKVNLPLEELKTILADIENYIFVQVIDGEAVELKFETVNGELFLMGARKGPVFIIRKNNV